MSNNKQSSVDWLFCELIDKEYKNANDTELINIIEQAKAMHKEEIENSYIKGYEDKDFSYFDAENYYNETFNNEQTN